MKKFDEEVSHWDEYDYVVVNDDLDLCYKKILDLIISERKGIKIKQNQKDIEQKIKDLTK